MRDLLVFGFTLLAVPLAFMAPFAGYLLWGWAGLIALNYYLYGFMTGVAYVQLFAIVTIVALALRREPGLLPFKPHRTTVLLGLFVAHGLMVALLAYPGLARNWELFGNVAKTALFCALMPMLATNRFRIHALVLMVALAVSFHGALDGLKFIASGGGHNAQAIVRFGDNNNLALVLVMVLPLLYYLYRYSAGTLARYGFAAAVPLTVLAVVATSSRGALMGMVAIAIWIVLKSRKKVLGMAVVGLCAVMVLQMAPDKWSSRMETIQTADQDASFMGRVAAWKVSSAIAVAHPVFGGGFRALQSHPVWDSYKYSEGLLGFVETPTLNRSGVAAHSIWFEVLGDQGFVGLFIFVALLVNGFVTRREVWTLVRRNGAQQQWAGDLADMLGAALLAYVVTGSLLSAAYFELPYVGLMLLEVIKQHQLRLAAGLPSVKAG
jgi:probable O-glycosylation ligase (exosortase A-associated)